MYTLKARATAARRMLKRIGYIKGAGLNALALLIAEQIPSSRLPQRPALSRGGHCHDVHVSSTPIGWIKCS